jgi:hypothetical protein
MIYRARLNLWEMLSVVIVQLLLLIFHRVKVGRLRAQAVVIV